MDQEQEATTRLSTSQLQRVRDLFHAVIDRNPDDISAYLQEICGEDVAVRIELERMLLAHGATDE